VVWSSEEERQGRQKSCHGDEGRGEMNKREAQVEMARDNEGRFKGMADEGRMGKE